MCDAVKTKSPLLRQPTTMEVVNPCSALLSNYEVLTLLKELENDHLERSKTAMRIKKEEDSLSSSTSIGTTGGTQHTYHHNTNYLPDISENLRTIQVEAIQYLSSDYLPTNSQSPSGISQLVKDLTPYDLTKAEKLQIVNLAPTLPVELYVIVEELEDRLGDSMDAILSTVKSSLPSPLPPPTSPVVTMNGTTEQPQMIFTSTATSLLQEPTTTTMTTAAATSAVWDDMDAEAIIDDMDFIDHGEGAGIEGDLDVEDD
ncbi:hypothetical protein AGABI2DRAFT_179185 [Agaricus bisporus var. bisporus H97]|uniref:hypothetical protein n=1 Tax=Agaricus bisporus var. bisporus (strain H97 / ATCC MYA-4626 / FGSC 10389) TaxID=936046 RepID=UPI00029F4EF3|nr:hypothetical protein AGABI2DRAFT_179185 [Agaricus bisporus var. bisporus H97]EKV45626.1 hypothetical protein AGABI2DRAFT_179185 [Agaricus bisporus var. bisporus H97]